MMVGHVCKQCGGNEFNSEGGMYVCQHCGSKYTSEEINHAIVEPLLELSFRMIAKYINGIDPNGNSIRIRGPEYFETKKISRTGRESGSGELETLVL